MSASESRSAGVLELAEEFLERYRRGERPSLKEYAARYPDLAAEIHEVFPAMALMENIALRDESLAGPTGPEATLAAPRLEQFGDYRIIREVGRGGMGIVYEAEQLSLGRHVALKVLPSHALLDPRQLQRFQREAKAVARLHHTNIVPVYGVGEHDGLHYYVMQFIQGLPLDEVLGELRRFRRTKQPAEADQADIIPPQPGGRTQDLSAGVLAQSLVAGAFQGGATAAEPTGAVPPAALACLRGDGEGARPEVAAAGAESLESSRSPTLSGPSPGSPASETSVHLPGQSRGSSLSESGRQYWQSVARVGVQVAEALAYAASQGVLHRDIKPSNLLLDLQGTVWVTDFGLAKAATDTEDLTQTGDIIGTVRYLAPERFHGQTDIRGDLYSLGLTLYEMLTLRPAFGESDRNKLVKQVLHDEPVRPRKLNPAVPRDLETIILKAIARDPAHRYQTPAEMAEDLKRFVEDRPVRARRASEAEKFWRWCRRNPLVASLLAGIVLVFLAGFTGVSWQWREAAAAREDEKHQRSRAVMLWQDAETARDEAKRREGEAVTARDEAKQARNTAARQAAGLLLDRGIEDARGGEPARALHLFVRALGALPPDDPQAAPLERAIRANLSAWAETVPALEHIFLGGPRFDRLAYTPDGEAIAMAVNRDEVQCFRTDTGRPVGPPVKILVGTGAAMQFAADGRSLWVASPGTEKVVEKWALHRIDPASGQPVQPPIPSPGPVDRLALTPDGQYLVGVVLGLHPDDRGPMGDAEGTRTWRMASIMVWEPATGWALRKEDVNADQRGSLMGLTPDGKAVTVWFVRGSYYEGLTVTLDGREPATSLGRHPYGTTPSSYESYECPPIHFQHSMRTALAIKDGQLHRWSATKPAVLGPGVPTRFRIMLNRPAADGRSVTSPVDGRVYDTGAWPPRPTGVRFAHPGWQGSSPCLEESPDGRFAATWNWLGSGDGRFWRLPRPRSRPALPPAEFARQPERTADHLFAQFDPRGTSAVLWASPRAWWHGPRADDTNDIRLVDVATGAVRGTSIRHLNMVREVVFTPDGRHFATASFDSTARVWETATGRPAGPPLPHTNYVATVAFSPDGNTLAAGDYGPAGLVKLWDWRTGKEVRPPLRHDDIILSVTFSPDGRYLAAIKAPDWSKNPELLVWEVASGRAVVRMRHNAPSFLLRELVRFRPDGRVITTRDVNGVLRLWELPSGKPLGEPRPLDGDGVTRFSPDGRVVAAAANLGVRLLDGDTLAPLPAGYLPHPDRIKDVAFSPDGAFLLTAHETGSAQLWAIATRKPVGPPAVFLGPIRAVSFTPDGKSCLCVAADGTVRRWPVPAPFAEPDLARLADRVALTTGQRMDDNQGLDSIPAKEWRALRAKLVGEGSTALVPPRPDADWHDAVAADAEQDGDAYGAEWHLDRLVALRPSDWTIPARRGRILAVAGRRDEADVAYAAARRLAPTPQVLSDWLRAAAADDEAAGRKEAALWNLDRAIALTPGDWTLYALWAGLADPARAIADEDEAIRLGAEPTLIEGAADRAAGTGDWKRAATLLTQMARNPDLPMPARYLQAVACLKAGDVAGYRAACAGMAQRLPRGDPKLSHHESNSAAKASALGPKGTDDWPRALAWTEHALTRLAEIEKARPALKEVIRRERNRFMNTRGAVLYRAGRFEEAAKVLREGMNLHPNGGEFDDWLFLALAEYRLGHAGAAKAAAAKARAVPRPNTVWERAEVEVLTAELDAALPPGK
jgi:serine/threonine protein kinase/WD40 repeat protein/Flp pilus assembly protein TadD